MITMVRRKFGVAVIALAVTAAATGASATDPQSGAREVVQSMGDAVIATLRAGADKARREAVFRELYRRNFDNAGIAAWAAGRAFTAAAPAERQAYLQAFEVYIIKAYSAQLSKYKGERLRVEKTEADGQDVIVVSKLVDPDPRAMRELEFRWRLHPVSGRLMVSDVVIDKISMGLTEKRAFAEWLREKGGTLAGLTQKLKEKAAEVDRD
jgi:phospholipid transport system substrate-binding protein